MDSETLEIKLKIEQQGSRDNNHKLCNIGSAERSILYMQVLLKCCYI